MSKAARPRIAAVAGSRRAAFRKAAKQGSAALYSGFGEAYHQAMPELKRIREFLDELAAGDDRLRESFTNWLAEHDRRKLPPRKAPASERPAEAQNRRKSR